MSFFCGGFQYNLGHKDSLEESTYRYVKQNGTFRQRLSMHQFISELETGFIHLWSVDRASTYKVLREEEIVSEPKPNYKYFHSKPDISSDD